MKQILIILATFCSISAFSQSGNATDIHGSWMGVLESIRIVFNIEEVNDSTIVTLDSPDQGAMGIPTSRYSYKRGSLIIEVDVINGKYVGNYDLSGEIFIGTWFQNGLEFPLNLARFEGIDEINRPQEPKPPFPYLSEEVVFPSKSDGVTLAGTLTLPEEGEQFPAVVLVTGSGPQNRNEEIMGHKPFLVISDYLTRSGIAVLRYDDRGYGDSTGDLSSATTGDLAQDAMGAYEYLLKDPRIDPEKIGIIGHSEGAMIAAQLASGNPDIGFIIMLAGPGLSGEETLRLQAMKILEVSGESSDFIDDAIKLNGKLVDIVISEPDDEIAEKKLRKTYDKFTKGMSDQEKARLGFSPAMINASIQELLNPWMRYFLAFDIKDYLVNIKCPVLVLAGDKDLQVPPAENIPPIENALNKGGNMDVKVVVFPDLNHLFQNAVTGSPSEYGNIEETFAPVVLEEMADWISVLFSK